jgi:hypothetical protein
MASVHDSIEGNETILPNVLLCRAITEKLPFVSYMVSLVVRDIKTWAYLFSFYSSLYILLYVADMGPYFGRALGSRTSCPGPELALVLPMWN